MLTNVPIVHTDSIPLYIQKEIYKNEQIELELEEYKVEIEEKFRT